MTNRIISRAYASPKRDFAIAHLRTHPETTAKTLSAAWRKAGNSDQISANIYYLAKRELAREQEAVIPVQAIPATNGRHIEPAASVPAREASLDAFLWDFEIQLDTMILAVMTKSFPNRHNIEELLRSARRQVIYASKDLVS